MKILGLAAALALSGPVMAAPAPEILSVPGFADFITVEGDSVWVTNKGRVERWSRQGKQAEVALAKPCGTMALTPGALWVADCGAKTISRIDTATNKIVAVIPTGLASPDGEMNVVSGAGSVWVASDAKGLISRIDPADQHGGGDRQGRAGQLLPRLRPRRALGGQCRQPDAAKGRSGHQQRRVDDQARQGAGLPRRRRRQLSGSRNRATARWRASTPRAAPSADGCRSTRR